MSTQDIPAIKNIRIEEQIWNAVPDINEDSTILDVKQHAQAQKSNVKRTNACITEVKDYVCTIHDCILKLTQRVTSRMAENIQMMQEITQSLQAKSK